MEENLKRLFEFQCFSPNARLSEMIADVQYRYAQLSDEDLELVAAAGEIFNAQGVEGNAWDKQQ